ncbi:hypothetical protein [Edaphobacter aggregans]|uniref:hypothetical protein n=1 Tax=Edaphobacter aggregans TaxID=570835 RepID=UPI0005507823|nr:hypothetical protein [Edaphobacter aggregans]
MPGAIQPWQQGTWRQLTPAHSYSAIEGQQAMVLMVVVSLAASLIPALRATQISPLAVLREE